MAVPRTAGVPTLLLSQTLAKLHAGAGGQPARLGYRGRTGRKPHPCQRARLARWLRGHHLARWQAGPHKKTSVPASRLAGSRGVSADDRSLENPDIGSPPTPSENVPSPIAIGRRDGCWDWRTS